jgi:hypothetical protein
VGPHLFGQIETGPIETDVSPGVFAPLRRDKRMAYSSLHCRCGSNVFRISGWPRVVSGPGGFFWRTLARVWREARLATKDGELTDSPFWLPIFLDCSQCGLEESLFDDGSVAGLRGAADRADPRESIRCRQCRRSCFKLVAGVVADPGNPSRVAVELVSRCHRCQFEARVAWSDGLPSDREIQLDLLYGRR